MRDLKIKSQRKRCQPASTTDTEIGYNGLIMLSQMTFLKTPPPAVVVVESEANTPNKTLSRNGQEYISYKDYEARIVKL